MFTLKYHVPLTAAALLALAACGSGSDNGADPAATVKSLADGGAAQTSLAKKADAPEASAAPADAAAPAAEGAAAPASAEAAPADAAAVNALAAASPAAAAALENNPAATAQAADATTTVTAATDEAATADATPITSAGVRGDVILSILDRFTCHGQTHASGPNGKQVDEKYPTIRQNHELTPSNYQDVPNKSYPYGDRKCRPEYSTYHAVAPGAYELEESENRYSGLPFRDESRYDSRFNTWQTTMALSVTNDSFTLGGQVKAEAFVDTQNGDASKPPVGSNQTLTLNTDKPFSAAFSSRVPYGVLSVWKDGQGHNYQLMLLPGNTGEARLCWNVNADVVKRLSCSTWTAPQGWKRGDQLKDGLRYTIDDRTAYGEQGLVYFNNNGK